MSDLRADTHRHTHTPNHVTTNIWLAVCMCEFESFAGWFFSFANHPLELVVFRDPFPLAPPIPPPSLMLLLLLLLAPLLHGFSRGRQFSTPIFSPAAAAAVILRGFSTSVAGVSFTYLRFFPREFSSPPSNHPLPYKNDDANDDEDVLRLKFFAICLLQRGLLLLPSSSSHYVPK